jgi:hypothetical protein
MFLRTMFGLPDTTGSQDTGGSTQDHCQRLNLPSTAVGGIKTEISVGRFTTSPAATQS